MAHPTQMETLPRQFAVPDRGQAHGRLVLQTVVPTDQRSTAGRSALGITLELEGWARPADLMARIMSTLLFTLPEQAVGVLAEVVPNRSLASDVRAVFATEDADSLCTVIAQHWRDDRRLLFSVFALDDFHQAVARLGGCLRWESGLALMRVVQNQGRSGLIVRSGSLNAVRARRQVASLCEQYGLDLVL